MTIWALVSAILAGAVSLISLGIAAFKFTNRCQTLRQGQPSRETRNPNQESNSLATFGRDVIVNVLANLIAAAIVYIAGVLAGFFPKSPGLVLGSALMILVGGSIVLYFASFLLNDRPRTYVLSISLTAVGLAGQIAPFVADSGLDTLEQVLYPLGGMSAIVLAVASLFEFGSDQTNS